MKTFLTTFTALFLIVFSNLLGLNRDYKTDCDEDNAYQNYYYPYCLIHAPNAPDWIASSLVDHIPSTGPTCRRCNKKSIYLGYIDPDYKKYRSHLEQQLKHSEQHTNCNCYWPEYSSEAADISNLAYFLFKDLISTTALSNLLDDENEQRAFVDNSGWFLNKHGLTISFIAQQFRFSDYYHVCKDIENYAKAKYKEREVAKIKDKLEDILEALYPKFFALHNTCYSKHKSSNIEQEIRLMMFLTRNVTRSQINCDFLSSYDNKSYDVSEFIINNLETTHQPVELENKGVKTELGQSLQGYSNEFECSLNTLFSLDPSVILRSFSIESEIRLEQGTFLNDLLLYKDAIKYLTDAIKLNPANRDAYIERATAYFETNQLELALKDYEKAKQLKIIPPFKQEYQQAATLPAIIKTAPTIYIPENKKDFTKGLVLGTLEGGKVMVVELIPSTLSSLRGILNGLWAFALSPKEVSREMAIASYAMGEYISLHSTIECLECVVPELKELSLSWHKIDDYSRGKKIGYIIGKYGLEAFIPIGAIKGVSKLRALKRANTMCTLKCCEISQATRAAVLEESAKRVITRETLLKAAKGRILIKNPNVKFHVMQKKHAWDKLIKLTGNIEEDFKKVLNFLEEKKIIDTANIIGKPRKFPLDNPRIIRVDYKKIINGQEVRTILETYLESGEIFLNDAWVVTE